MDMLNEPTLFYLIRGSPEEANSYKIRYQLIQVI